MCAGQVALHGEVPRFSMAKAPGTAWAYLRNAARRLFEPIIVFILAFDGTDFGAFAAAGTFGRVHIAGLLQELYCEVSRLAGNFLNFRKGQKLDVEMPADLDQLGGDNSHRAVVGGEGLVELRHHSADGGGFFDQVDIKAGVGKIERRLHAGDPAADHHNGTNRSITFGLHKSTPLKFLMISRNNVKTLQGQTNTLQ